VKFYTEIELESNGHIGEKRFVALADALYDLDASDPEISDTDVGASLTDGRATVSMTVEAADPADAGTKALCTVRSATHTIRDATPGWETARSVIRVGPSDASDRLFAST
jgi:hypothetical protein